MQAGQVRLQTLARLYECSSFGTGRQDDQPALQISEWRSILIDDDKLHSPLSADHNGYGKKLSPVHWCFLAVVAAGR